jgi:hypothetical protein
MSPIRDPNTDLALRREAVHRAGFCAPEIQRISCLFAETPMGHIPAMATLLRFLPVLVLAIPMAGCLTTSPEQQAKRNEERCVNRGYKPGSDEFKDCVVRIKGERDQRKETNRRYEMEKSPNPFGGTRGY